MTKEQKNARDREWLQGLRSPCAACSGMGGLTSTELSVNAQVMCSDRVCWVYVSSVKDCQKKAA